MTPTKPTFRFAFGPRNYRLMWLGLALLTAGFVTMMLGDKANYGEDFLGITLGPLLVLAGFGVEFAAILVRDQTLNAAPTPAAVSPAFVAEAPPAAAAAPVPVPAPAPAYKRR